MLITTPQEPANALSVLTGGHAVGLVRGLMLALDRVNGADSAATAAASTATAAAPGSAGASGDAPAAHSVVAEGTAAAPWDAAELATLSRVLRVLTLAALPPEHHADYHAVLHPGAPPLRTMASPSPTLGGDDTAPPLTVPAVTAAVAAGQAAQGGVQEAAAAAAQGEAAAGAAGGGGSGARPLPPPLRLTPSVAAAALAGPAPGEADGEGEEHGEGANPNRIAWPRKSATALREHLIGESLLTTLCQSFQGARIQTLVPPLHMHLNPH